METLLLIEATLMATTAMTVFSYIISASFRDLYKEPVLLEFVLSGLSIDISKTQKSVAGWVLHYLIGFLFVLGYFIPMDFGYYNVSWISGLVFGAIIGAIGIVSWMIMFRLSGHMPIDHPLMYYVQLFVAHLIFGLTTVAVCFLMN